MTAEDAADAAAAVAAMAEDDHRMGGGEDGGDNMDDDDDDDDSGDDLNPDGTPNDTKAKKRRERLEQNRISARESRKRKKTMIEELQRTVITLSRENKDLNDRNEQLRTQLMQIGTKVSATTNVSIYYYVLQHTLFMRS
jgi:hypothetical protein